LLSCIILALYCRFFAFSTFSQKHATPTPWVLFIKLDGLGDHTLWLPFGDLLCVHYKQLGYKVAVATCQPEFLGLFFKTDLVIPVDMQQFRSNLACKYGIYKQIYNLRPEIVIVPSFFKMLLDMDIFVLGLQGLKIALAGLRPGWSKRIYHVVAPNANHNTDLSAEASQHELWQYASLYQTIMRHIFSTTPVPVSLQTMQSIQNTVWQFYTNRMPGMGVTKQTYLYICVDSAEIAKNWPIDNFIAVAIHVIEHQWVDKVVFSGKATSLAIVHKNLTTQLETDYNAVFSNNTYEYYPVGSLEQHIQRIKQASCVLCNDTANGHIAYVLQTPYVVLINHATIAKHYFPIPGKHKNVFLQQKQPCGCANGSQCNQKNSAGVSQCITHISTQDAIQAVSVLLQQKHIS
jgi:ADP-heptose:LPS heptosyltransferase